MSLDHEIFKSKLYQTVVSCARKEKKDLYLVGGFLRDLVIKHQKVALDLDFSLKSGAIDFGRLVARSLRAGFVILDREHGCSRVVYKDKKTGKPLTLDFVDFRGKDLKEDLYKRDFTINTLAMSVARGPKDIYDFYGALKDIAAKKIQVVAPSSFQEDSLRILRAFS